MASNEDTSPVRPRKKLFARWRRKETDTDQDATVAEGLSPEQVVAPQVQLGSSPAFEASAAAEGLSSVEVDQVIKTVAGTDTEVLHHEETSVNSPALDAVAAVPDQADGLDKTSAPGAPEERSVRATETEALSAERADHLDRDVSLPDPPQPAAPEVEGQPQIPKRANVFSRALSKTGRGLETLFLGRRQIDEQMLEELETQLLMADVGVEVCTEIIDELTDRVKRRELSSSDALRGALHQIMVEILSPCEQPLDITQGKPCVMLVVGINGVGKTTTIGKLARNYQNQGLSVMLAAGDTFRAAAVEQLQVWGERNEVPVIAQHTGADSASVIYDAIESAAARNTDVLIADTAGRLHTKSNLMDELAKVKRVMAKLNEDAPHEVLLVLDAGTGQNAIRQVQEFNETVEVTGLAITKLDGTAKGGVVLALCKRYGIPVRYVGVGEGLDDLQTFRAEDYVQALLSETPHD